ncbi:hypothetical protein RJ639_032740 [Escallonia herrerae]|uniref:Cysteine-rich receptor-like protein kinase 42 n=1 Tax=Escallonia herrerae TaxID=1293975 RepID=A0AA89BIY9_9ASTE|nr:hypothetical protein RJ639_032740 [Escallonia herrerae]
MAMNDEYIAGFTGVMQDLDRRVRAERLISYSAQLPSSNIHGFAQCHADLSQEDCTSCYHVAESRLKACVPAVSGSVYLDGCFVRFVDHKFRHENVLRGPNSAKCGEPSDTLRDKNIEKEFAEKIEAAIANVTEMAAVNKGFGAAEVKSGVLSAYALGQCWSTLDENQCGRCLRDAANKVCKCLPGAEGMGMNAGCYLKYSTSKFFYHSAMKKESGKYELLEQATGCFDPSNKLGQGGCGSVFEGTLPDDKKNMTQIITWQQRFDIILGIAEGLAHLHNGCKAKIIHRDIKNSNILLDENLTPKIADFGLARGYMAPEYLIRGQLTEKADVYAFGVLALEIACGRKNSVFMNDSGSVLQCVWKHHKSDDITKSIDRSLIGNFPEKTASNALQVGLLCTQTCARYRPSMYSVVQMLTEKENVLPSPKQPPFLNSSVLLSDDTTKSSETNKLSSNWHTTIEVPFTASKSASTASPQPHE